MQPDVGKIYEGKVTGITNFGAFVEIEPGVTGMVRISEVANTFVNEISEHLTIGQEVKVKVLSVNDDGKISLSIKKAMDNPQPQRKDFRQRREGGPRNDRSDRKPTQGQGRDSRGPRQSAQEKVPQTKEAAFEDMMNKWKQRSDEKMGDIKRNMDSKRRNTSRRRGGGN